MKHDSATRTQGPADNETHCLFHLRQPHSRWRWCLVTDLPHPHDVEGLGEKCTGARFQYRLLCRSTLRGMTVRVRKDTHTANAQTPPP